ncbi:MAG TPA: YbhB/YbcL family Raf kinase inhibitor-like protein [Candidatus Babeliales bacterium]|nr:YbhB/YbcL family Raf kinase inhibitor-like protein [Candidatus Babeliales bacterium]
MKKKLIISGMLLVSLGIIGCIFSGFAMPQLQLTLTTTSFNNGGKIPQQYSCDGENISPALSWEVSDAAAVKSYVLIVDDPDAQKAVGKTFVHWIALMPATVTELPQGISRSGAPANAVNRTIIELPNDDNEACYKGPCPPQGKGEHTYQFTLFAMNLSVEKLLQNNGLKAPYTAQQFQKVMQKNIVAQAQITGRYRR